jgi:hypothetical protein
MSQKAVRLGRPLVGNKGGRARTWRFSDSGIEGVDILQHVVNTLHEGDFVSGRASLNNAVFRPQCQGIFPMVI